MARKSLERGSFLVPRLGEYSAITICHKLRRFDVEIFMGLTEEVRPPKSYSSDDSGLASKHTVYNSRSHHFQLNKEDIDPEEVLVSTTPYLENYDVIEYLAIASENTIIDSKTLEAAHSFEEQLISSLPDYQKDKKRQEQIRRQNYAASASSPVDNILELESRLALQGLRSLVSSTSKTPSFKSCASRRAKQKATRLLGSISMSHHLESFIKMMELNSRSYAQGLSYGSTKDNLRRDNRRRRHRGGGGL